MEIRNLDSLAQAGVAAIEAEAASTTRIVVIVADGITNAGYCAPFTLASSRGLGTHEAAGILAHALSHLQGEK